VNGHYLVLTFKAGKEDVRREYFSLIDDEESQDAALARWAKSHPDMFLDGRPRQKNIERTLARLMAEPLYVQIARPTSWYREKGLGAFAEPGTGPTSRKRRRR
jgi:hypothetical protein